MVSIVPPCTRETTDVQVFISSQHDECRTRKQLCDGEDSTGHCQVLAAIRSICTNLVSRNTMSRFETETLTQEDCGCCSGVTLFLPSRSYTSIWNKGRSGTPSGFPPIR